MAAIDPIVFRQLPLIQKIIADETWLEGERRGCWVSSEDPIVRDNVCTVILRVGAGMRASLVATLLPAGPAVIVPIGSSDDHTPHAA